MYICTYSTDIRLSTLVLSTRQTPLEKISPQVTISYQWGLDGEKSIETGRNGMMRDRVFKD